MKLDLSIVDIQIAKLHFVIECLESAEKVLKKYDKLQADALQKQFDDALNEKLKEKGLEPCVPTNCLHFASGLLHSSLKPKQTIDYKYQVNGKTYKINLEKGDTMFVENDKVYLKRELTVNCIINCCGDNKNGSGCFMENGKRYYKYELKAEE